MKTIKFLVAASALWAGSAHADLQCDLHEAWDDWFGGGVACPGGLPASTTGDDAGYFQGRLNANPGLADFLIDFLDADLEAGNINDLNSQRRRFVNAGILLDDIIGPDGEHWLEWVTDWSACFWMMDHCGDSGGLRGEASGVGSVGLTGITMNRITPVERASTMVHEAGHFFEAHIGNDECPAGASCDLSLDDDGPQANQIEFMMDTKAQMNALPDPLWESVRNSINGKLNRNFARHPGFNVGRPNAWFNGAYRSVAWDVSEGWAQAAFFPDPDDAPQAITGIGLSVEDETVVRLRLTQRSMASDGRLIGGAFSRNVGLDTNAPLERTVNLPNGYVATGLLVRATDDGVTHLGLRGRRLLAQPTGTLVNEIVVWANNQSTGAPETNFTVPHGELLTGLGLRMVGGNLTVHSFKSELPRGFTSMVGGNGGSPIGRATDSMSEVTGVLIAPEGAGNSASIGFFGLVSARRVNIDAGQDPIDAAASVFYTGYFDEETNQLHAGGSASYYQVEIGNLGPDNMQQFFCPAGQSVVGLGLMADNLVRRLSWIRCSGGNYVFVNVGPIRGSFEQLSCDRDRNTGDFQDLVINGFRARSGWRLDQLRLHCTAD